MNTNHTPAPWKIDGGSNKKGDLFIWRDGQYIGGHAIATIHNEIQEGAKANARLIASSPDLLAALEEIAKGEGAFSLDPLTHAGNTIENMKAIARAAIENAKGHLP